mmetsp:Transcript_90590/g.255777  ORF Transcript_90590/g.255777 Transcript_90590/m.255777 type:complete len:242 (-) Transcript_90590:2163-2888(-)
MDPRLYAYSERRSSKLVSSMYIGKRPRTAQRQQVFRRSSSAKSSEHLHVRHRKCLWAGRFIFTGDRNGWFCSGFPTVQERRRCRLCTKPHVCCASCTAAPLCIERNGSLAEQFMVRGLAVLRTSQERFHVNASGTPVQKPYELCEIALEAPLHHPESSPEDGPNEKVYSLKAPWHGPHERVDSKLVLRVCGRRVLQLQVCQALRHVHGNVDACTAMVQHTAGRAEQQPLELLVFDRQREGL